MEEYLRILLEQVRCKKAHPMIEKEIKNHIEDQIEANRMEGMDEEEAEREAIKDMGDAVEVGVSMDRIHKPRIAWGMIGIMTVVMIAAIVLQFTFGDNMYNRHSIKTFIKSSFIGCVFMLLIFWLDYTYFAKWAKGIALLMNVVCFCTLLFGNSLYGVHYSIPFTSFSIQAFMLLYVPIYGAVLYQYRGQKWNGILKALIWMLIPVLMAFRIPSVSLAFVLYMSMLILLSFGVAKNWFQVHKRITNVTLWSALMGVPIILFILRFPMLAEYQKARILAFWKTDQEQSYTTKILRQNLINSKLLGASGEDLSAYIPDVKSDFIISYITSTYGILLTVLICGLFAILLVKGMSVTVHQKNQAGMMIGIGCITVLSVTAVMNILENIGLFPLTWTFLPFFSEGTSGIVICYILIGFIMSIYRYKDVYQEELNDPKEATKKFQVLGYQIFVEKKKDL